MSVARVAVGLPVSWPTVHQALVAHAEATLTDPSPPVHSVNQDLQTPKIASAMHQQTVRCLGEQYVGVSSFAA